MLDLTTPFCIVMAVNAANYLLNELLMVTFPYGMAGCGWASVISQVRPVPTRMRAGG
jgi:Na+-driven multidrug efflux pump